MNGWNFAVRIFLLVWAMCILLPVFWIVYQSFKTNPEFFQSIWAFPENLQFSNYTKAWTKLNVVGYLRNTFIVLFISLVVTTVITTMSSYIFARFSFTLNKALFGLVIVGMMLPGLNALTAQYILMKNLGLLNSLTGLSIFLAAIQISFSVFILTGFMKTVPKEIEESAYVDGSGYTNAFLRIILPMTIPGIAAVNIFNFLGVYNAYIPPLLFISDEKKFPISIGLQNMYVLQQYRADWVTLFAGIVISMVPMLVFYAIFQRHLISGTNIGAIKG